MPRLRVFDVDGGDTFSPRLRVRKVAGSGNVAILSPRLRVFKASGSGNVPIRPSLRVYRAAGSGTVSLVLNPIAGLSAIEPGSTVQITATAAVGIPDGWVWRQISGPAVQLVGIGATVSFVAPSAMAGTSVTLGVTGSSASVVSAERTVSVQVLPQTVWTYSSGTWRGSASQWV